jgi:hypothetical protein
MNVAASSAQEAIQPTRGPSALPTQTKTVPASGSRATNSRSAIVMQKIGTKPSSRAAGAWVPTAATRKPSVTAML